MRALCFIDNLGGGGAQRQLCRLATLLKGAGLDVSMLTYHEGGVFAEQLDRAGIARHVAPGDGGLRRVLAVRRVIASVRPDVVLAFLPMPCLYAELAGLLGRRWGLIVGERSTTAGAQTPRMRMMRALHRTADAVVTNSHANRKLIETSVPALRGRVSTVYNAVDLEAFAPTPTPPRGRGPLRFVVAANYRTLKNPSGWIEAVRLAMDRACVIVATDWYGGGRATDSGTDERAVAAALVAKYRLDRIVRLHDACSDIAGRYAEAHVVALPSLLEGLPNAICEGMACGRTVASSDVSDAAMLVEHRVNGVLFDPTDTSEMAEQIAWLAEQDEDALHEMGKRSRARAERLFDPRPIVASYLSLIEASAAGRRPDPVHWPDAA